MADTPTPTRPTTDVLANPDQTTLGWGIQFTKLLANDDSILRTKGGNYRIYQEVLRDDQCKSTFQQRRTAVTARDFQVDPASQSAEDVAAADAIRANLEALQFDRIVDKMLFAVWYGHAVGECLWDIRDGKIVLADVRVRDRARFLYDEDDSVYLVKVGSVEPMPPRKFWKIATGADHDDAPYGLGLAHFCYWPVFFKRNGIKFWLVFLEKFGMPTVIGKAQEGKLDDPKWRGKLLQALEAVATETAVAVPEGVEIELLEAARSGTADYSGMCAAMDRAIAKIVLSQTMTTDNGSSRSQAEVHQDVGDDVVKTDADLVCASFNAGPVAWLTAWNFPNAKPPRVWYNLEPEEDLNARADRDVKVSQLGFEPDEKYIQDTYGEGWKKKAAQALMPLGMTPNDAVDQVAAEFAELGALAADRTSANANQQALISAAQRIADRYRDAIGGRVQQIIDLGEQSQDFDTMRARLLELYSDAAPDATVNALTRSGFVARLLGAFRGQRPIK